MSPGTTGTVFDIQKFSIHDGPGIRTTVFFKGCPLRCQWCHNPESMQRQPHLSFDARRCIGCGACFAVCPTGVHCLSEGQHLLGRDRCRRCGACVDACYAGALEVVGWSTTVDAVLQTVLEDRSFYGDSGGGMTLSGGEPTWQPDFALALLEAARAEGIHTAVDTCGFCAWSILERLLPWCDLFLYDLKAVPEQHERFTGVPFARIGENLQRLHQAGARLWIRLPVIPGVNDTDARFFHAAEMVRRMPGIEAVEVLSYHAMGVEKIGRMGLDFAALSSVSTPSAEQLQHWIDRLDKLGVRARRPGAG